MAKRGVLFSIMLNRFIVNQVCRKAGSGGLFRKGIVMGKKKNETSKPMDKHANFLRVAAPRVNKVIKALEMLANTAGVAYAPTKTEVADMFATIRSKIDDVENCYTEGASLETGFSFGGKVK